MNNNFEQHLWTTVVTIKLSTAIRKKVVKKISEPKFWEKKLRTIVKARVVNNRYEQKLNTKVVKKGVRNIYEPKFE